MKNKIDIFVELSGRLKRGIPMRTVECACVENSWFRASDIALAVEAICVQMLDRAKLEEWMGHYPTLPTGESEDVLIIMAGNIPLVGFFDLLCVVMAGHRAHVKCSSKDRVLMEYVIGVIRDIEPAIPIFICELDRCECLAPDRVIATGGDNAVRHFEAKYGETKRLLRGSRHSIAVVGESDGEGDDKGDGEGDNNVRRLADDVYMYSGLGCRNVSMVFIPRGYVLNVPCVETHVQYRNNYLQNRALLSMRGVEFEDNGASIFIESDSFPTSLSSISVCEYDNLEAVEAWIEEHDEELQCIVSNCMEHPRRVDFGESQHPSLYDYADAVDTMKFLM